MAREGADYSQRTADAHALRKAGMTFAMRYLSHDDGKNLHQEEARLLSSAGIDVGVVWETTANRALSGHAGGVQDAHQAAAQAKACGMPIACGTVTGCSRGPICERSGPTLNMMESW